MWEGFFWAFLLWVGPALLAWLLIGSLKLVGRRIHHH